MPSPLRWNIFLFFSVPTVQLYYTFQDVTFGGQALRLAGWRSSGAWWPSERPCHRRAITTNHVVTANTKPESISCAHLKQVGGCHFADLAPDLLFLGWRLLPCSAHRPFVVGECTILLAAQQKTARKKRFTIATDAYQRFAKPSP